MEVAELLRPHYRTAARQVPLHPRPQITAITPQVQGFEPHFRQFEHLVVPGLTVDN